MLYSTGWLNWQARAIYWVVPFGLTTVSVVPCIVSTGATVVSRPAVFWLNRACHAAGNGPVKNVLGSTPSSWSVSWRWIVHSTLSAFSAGIPAAVTIVETLRPG